MQSLIKISISPYSPSTAIHLISKEISISVLKYSITINEQVFNRETLSPVA